MYLFRQCDDLGCRFRYPVAEHELLSGACPLCGASTSVVARGEGGEPRKRRNVSSSPPFYALLDNLRSVFNVGSIFRTADGVGLGHLFLCGITPTPEHRKLTKTALGAEIEVPWSSCTNGLDQVYKLKAAGCEILALEARRDAASLFQYETGLAPGPTCMIVGNELAGIDPGIIEVCDRVLQIPMQGSKRSLNVAIAFSIAAYWLRVQQTAHRADESPSRQPQ